MALATPVVRHSEASFILAASRGDVEFVEVLVRELGVPSFDISCKMLAIAEKKHKSAFKTSCENLFRVHSEDLNWADQFNEITTS